MSPLQRTLETAVGVFGGGPGNNGDESCLLMRGQSDAPHERTAHDPVVLPAHGPPFVACEQCRERVGAAHFLFMRWLCCRSLDFSSWVCIECVSPEI